MKIWNSLVDQVPYIDFSINNELKVCLESYLEVFFDSPDNEKSLNIFTKFELLEDDKFESAIEKRFSAFREMFLVERGIFIPIFTRINEYMASCTSVT